MIQQQKTFTFNIPAGTFDRLEVPTRETEGIWTFNIRVEQQRAALDDIGAYVLDRDNFLVWQTRQQAVRAGASQTALPTVDMLVLTKLNWGTISFHPPAPGQYYLVLDNFHSSVTSKTVQVTASWLTQESGARRAVRESLHALGWMNTWKLFEEAESNTYSNKLPAACLHMRAALATLWKQVAERNSGQQIHFDPGKSTDISLLQKPMESYVPICALSMVRHSWSLASELAHIEKREGTDPPLDQVELALRSIYASSAFLVSLITKNS